MAVRVFVATVVGILDGCWCEQRFQSVVPGLLVFCLFLRFVFVVVRFSPVCLFHSRLGGWAFVRCLCSSFC